MSLFDIINFSDVDTVKGLIKFRWQLDPYWRNDRGSDPMEVGGNFGIREDIITTYVVLDEYIAECRLNEKQRFVLHKYMDGYTDLEIGRMFGRGSSHAENILNTACGKVVDLNREKWLYDYIYATKLKTPFEYKKCTRCGETKPVNDDFFHRDALGKDGFRNTCRTCR